MTRTDHAFLHLEHAIGNARAKGAATGSLELIRGMVCNRASHCPLHQADLAGTVPEGPRKFPLPSRPLTWEGDDA